MFIDGSNQSPPTHIQSSPTSIPLNNPDYLLWLKNDQHVMSVLLSSLTKDVYPVIISKKTHAVIWDALAKACALTSNSCILQLHADLHEIR